MSNALPHRIAIAGIHTGIGKTIVSAVVAEALGADYWKPVQAGLEERDTELVASLIRKGGARTHPEAVQLINPMSPHAAAAIEGVAIDYERFSFPDTANTLIVETAGGVLSPISASETMADFISFYDMPAILVSENYLGSINHTLAALDVIQTRGIKLLGIIINGDENPASESFITEYTSTKIIARVPRFAALTQEGIHSCAMQLKPALLEALT